MKGESDDPFHSGFASQPRHSKGHKKSDRCFSLMCPKEEDESSSEEEEDSGE